MNRFFKSIMLFAALAIMPVVAHAQAFVSSPATVALSYTVSEILTVSAAPSTLALSKSQQPITVTTTWNVQSNRTQLAVIGYVSSANPLVGTLGGSISAS